MLKKQLIVLILIIKSLSASWYDNFHPSIVAGMHLSNFEGNIVNINSKTDFKDDLKYLDTSSSYFAIGIKTDYKYIPHFYINYFSDTQTKDTIFSAKKYIANAIFDTNSTVSSIIDYQVINFILYKDFKIKGDRVRFLRWKFYPGDMEFDIGTNIKIVRWKIQLTKEPNSKIYPYWIEANEDILLPYIGFKYFYYNSRIYGNISALSVNEAKSLNYEIGFEYKLVKGLYISVSYLYEGFKVTEELDDHKDTISFKTVGNKFSFKYFF